MSNKKQRDIDLKEISEDKIDLSITIESQIIDYKKLKNTKVVDYLVSTNYSLGNINAK